MEGWGEMDQIDVQIVPNYTQGTRNPFVMDAWSRNWKIITETPEIPNLNIFALTGIVP